MPGTVLEFDVYPPDDPAGKISGTGLAAKLVTLTIADQLVDAGFVGELFGMGSGFLEIHIDNPDAELLTHRAYIKVRTVGSGGWVNEDLGGFWLERAELRVLSKGGQSERVVHWEGEGAALALDRYVLGHTVYASGQTKRGDISIPGKWHWSQEPYGAILVRVLEEGNDHPVSFFEFLDWDFDRTDDTNGNPWADLDDYEVPIGTSVLKVWSDFLRLGLVAEIDADLRVHAYRRLSEYRTDRHSATFASGKVRFQAGVNILSDMVKRINPSSQRTHVLIEDRIGDYQTYDEDVNNNPIDGVPYMAFLKSTTTADDTAIGNMGRLHLTYRDQFVDVCKVRHLLGPGGAGGEDGYGPSPTGDYWLGDLVTVHTGSGEHDYNEQTIEVAALRYFVQGNEWLVEAELGAQYRNWQQQALAGQIAQTIVQQMASLQLCTPDQSVDVDRVLLDRLYFSNNAGAGGVTPAVDAAWEIDDTGGNHKLLTTTPDATYGTSHQATNSATGQAGGKDICIYQGVYGPLSTAEAAAIAAGTLTVRAQFRARMRYGSGISEPAQDGISNIGVRVTTGASATIRGTALALHALGSSAGSSKWPAQATKINKQDPPAAASGDLSPVAGCVAGDYLIIEIGCRNFTTVTSGFAVGLTSSSGTDMGEDDSSSALDNAWIDLFIPGTSTLVGGDGRAELVGSSIKAKRCDDTEHWHQVGSDTPTVDDDVDAGFRNGTLWVNDDGAAYLLIDNAAGAADWLALSGGSSGGAPDTADYLVGTAQAGLSAEIVVGTTPGGELGGTWAAPTVDATHSGSAHHAEDHNHTGGGDGGDLDGAVIGNYLVFTEGSAAGTPSSGLANVYVKTDGRVYSKGDDGVERGPFDAAGAGGGSTGVVIGAPAGFPYIAATATTELTVNQTSHTINLPSGIVAGSLLLLFVLVDGGTTITASGFTSVTTGTSGTDVSLAVLYKFASGSEGATMSIGSSASEKVSCLAARIADHHASTPPEGAGTGSGTASVNSNPPSLTPSWGAANDLWIAFGVHDSSNPGAGFVHVGTPLPYLYLWHHAAAAVDDGTLSIGYRYLNAASTDPLSFVAPSGEQWAAATVAVRPV